MSYEDEARTLRSRVAALQDAIDRLDSDSGDGNPAMVVVTYTKATYPTAADKFFACHPVDPGGAEVEGGSASLTSSTGTVYVAITGNIPPTGTRLLARSVNGRWGAAYHGTE